MGVEKAFDDFQIVVNADKDRVDLARQRRDIFKKAFKDEPDVEEVFGSGSLARSTQLDPVHDVDLVVVYPPRATPTGANRASPPTMRWRTRAAG